MLTKAGDAVKDVFRRIDWLKVAKKAGGLAFTTFTGIPTPGQIAGNRRHWRVSSRIPPSWRPKTTSTPRLDGVKGLLKPEAETTNVPEEITAFRKAFDDLLEKLASSSSSS